MKTILTVTLCLCLAVNALAGVPKMTKEEVSQLGKRILSTKSPPYKDGFLLDSPTFSPKAGLWSFQPTGPLQSGMVYFFEIRDADGSHRIGTLSYDRGLFVPRSSETFKPSPGMKAKDRKR